MKNITTEERSFHLVMINFQYQPEIRNTLLDITEQSIYQLGLNGSGMELMVKTSGSSRKQFIVNSVIKMTSETGHGCVAILAGWYGLKPDQ